MSVSGFWRGGEDRLRCLDISDEAPGVKTFRMAPESGAFVHFYAGQFVTLELPLPSGPVWRCFTIASSPAQHDSISITNKRQDGTSAESGGTAWMHAQLAPGMRLKAMPPAGPFCLTAPPARPLLLVSAGSGATPMAAIARWMRDITDRTPVHYVHLGRTQADWLFKPEIEAIAAELGTWKLDWLATGGATRPDAAAFAAMSPDLAIREVFCCGPVGFMAAVEQAHAAAGGPAGAFRKEAFTAVPIPELTGTPAAPSARTTASGRHRLRFEPSGKEAEAGPEETLLAVATRLGLAIPYACGEGICGTCRIRRISGEVEMKDQGGIEEDEIAAGEILACCSYARSNLTLEML